jgi:nicotinamide mononucleotide transporter
MNTTHHNLVGILLGVALSFSSYVIGLYMGWINTLNLVEMLAVFTSFTCTYLTVVQSRTNYYWGVVSVALYSYLFWEQGLFGSMLLNVYLVPTLIWGWFRWGNDEKTRAVEFVKLYWWPVYIALTVIVWFLMRELSAYYGGTLTGPDSFILAASILAQFLLDQKKPETWVVWLVVNVVAIKLYFDAGLFLVAMQYVVFLLNTGFGAVMWLKSMRKVAVA